VAKPFGQMAGTYSFGAAVAEVEVMGRPAR